LTKHFLLSFLSLISLFLISGCNGLALDTYWRSERYVLLALDSKSQMSLSFDANDGTALGLVGPTVFSIGENDKYIVVKQHPSIDKFGSSFNRSVTYYFIVERSLSPIFSERVKGVRGPLEKEEFDKLTISLSLPPFTKTFDALK
jgi:hypothetical protein